MVSNLNGSVVNFIDETDVQDEIVEIINWYLINYSKQATPHKR